MLLWQPNERNKYLFLLELVVISTLAHLIVGVFLFVVYKGGVTSFRVELGKSHSATLFMPLKRHAGNGHGRSGRQGRGGSVRNKKSRQLTHAITTQAAQNSQQANGTADPVKEKEHRRLGSITTMGWDTTAPAKVSHSIKKSSIREKESNKRTKKNGLLHKKQQAHAKNKMPAKKEVIQKKEKLVPVEQAVNTLKKDVAAKSAKKAKHEMREQEPRIEEKPAAQIHQVVPAIKTEAPLEPTEPNIEEAGHELPAPDASIQQPEEQGAEIADGDKPEEVGDYGFDEITLGQEYDGEYITAEQARMYECVEREIASRWRPPRGLSKDLACQIKCSIGLSGAVVGCKIEKPSGVLIYDMAARTAARAMSLPRWAWGKEFTIIFKQ